MRSEIPQLDVVTAIGDAEAEDYVAQLLFTQGWNIIYRALDMDSLEKFLRQRGKELRTIIVYKSDLSNFSNHILENLASPTVTNISLDDVAINAHAIMLHLRARLRLPLITNQPAPVLKSEVILEKLEQVVITGTQGAPGRSTIALNLALELNYPIYDLDFKAPAQNYLINRNKIEIELKQLNGEKPREFKSEGHAVLDIGALPPLDELVNDRRWSAILLNSVLEQTTHLIYICRASGLSLIRLEKFISQFPILLRKIPVSYIFNLAGNSREERALEKHFIKMVEGESHLVIPSDIRLQNPTKNGSKAIGKLAALIS